MGEKWKPLVARIVEKKGYETARITKKNVSRVGYGRGNKNAQANRKKEMGKRPPANRQQMQLGIALQKQFRQQV